MKLAPVARLHPSRPSVARVASPLAPTPPLVAHRLRASVRVPAWFTATQAIRVAELKRVSHLLVEDRGRLAGVVDLEHLRQVPGSDAVARWTRRTEADVAPTAGAAEAAARMRAAGTACLPVVTGGLLVGTVSLEDLGPPKHVTHQAA